MDSSTLVILPLCLLLLFTCALSGTKKGKLLCHQFCLFVPFCRDPWVHLLVLERGYLGLGFYIPWPRLLCPGSDVPSINWPTWPRRRLGDL